MSAPTPNRRPDKPEKGGPKQPYLSPKHRRVLLRESAISPEIVAARGYWTATREEYLRELGFAPYQCLVPALVIPMYSPTGELISHQIKPDDPRKDKSRKDENGEHPTIKYETPAGSGVHLDVHPSRRELLQDTSVTAWITEGAKTADSLTSLGELVIMLQGVWCFDTPEWDDIPLMGRTTYIAFDSDATSKPPVQHAMLRLATMLAIRGAEVWVVFLPSGPNGEKWGLDDYLAAGGTLEELERLAEKKERPAIVTNGRFFRDITADAIGVLHAQNDPPSFFTMGTELVRLRGDGTEPLSPDALFGVLDRSADYVRASEKAITPAAPPQRVVADILSLGRLPFPELRGVVRSPVFTSEGELLSEDGYDERSRILLRRNGVGPVRADMSTGEALSWLLGDLLTDFPFESEGARAHALAMLLQPFVRQMIEGPTPLFLVDAPIRGSGKSLLTEVASYMATGEPAPIMGSTPNEEMEKRITALLLGGAQMIVIDNVESLRQSALAAALTSQMWKGRRLGKSETVRMENLALWVATGNNVSVSSEIARRTMSIRLDPETERPEHRADFRHPNLRRWVRRHRGELVSAALSLVARWLDEGAPRAQSVHIGSYEEWAEVMGGILGVAGVPGLLTGREYLEEESSQELREWKALCGAWWESYADLPVTGADVFEVARERTLLLELWGGRAELAGKQRFGHALAKRRDQVLGDYVIRSAGRDSKTGSKAFRLERRNGDGSGDQGKGNLSNENKTLAKPGIQNPINERNSGFQGFSGFSSDPGPQSAEGPSTNGADLSRDTGDIETHQRRKQNPRNPRNQEKPTDEWNSGRCFDVKGSKNPGQNPGGDREEGAEDDALDDLRAMFDEDEDGGEEW